MSALSQQQCACWVKYIHTLAWVEEHDGYTLTKSAKALGKIQPHLCIEHPLLASGGREKTYNTQQLGRPLLNTWGVGRAEEGLRLGGCATALVLY